jgi:hypothetical protein
VKEAETTNVDFFWNSRSGLSESEVVAIGYLKKPDGGVITRILVCRIPPSNLELIADYLLFSHFPTDEMLDWRWFRGSD